MMVGFLDRLSATEPFSHKEFQIINEVALMDDSPRH
jgi:hypothetical protein